MRIYGHFDIFQCSSRNPISIYFQVCLFMQHRGTGNLQACDPSSWHQCPQTGASWSSASKFRANLVSTAARPGEVGRHSDSDRFVDGIHGGDTQESLKHYQTPMNTIPCFSLLQPASARPAYCFICSTIRGPCATCLCWHLPVPAAKSSAWWSAQLTS